jgi:hypothetical protein
MVHKIQAGDPMFIFPTADLIISTPSHQLLSKFYLTMSNGGVNVLLAINNLYGN